MKLWEEINVKEILTYEDFYTLFAYKLPLTEQEKNELVDYYKIYETFLKAGVDNETAWISTRNIFVVKNAQIGERIKNNALTI